MAIKALLIDLDGTLCDSLEANYAAYSAAAAELGQTLDRPAFFARAGESFSHWGQHLLKLSGADLERIAKHKAAIYPDYFHLIKPNTTLIALATTLSSSYYLVLFTNASKANAQNVLRYFSLDKLFHHLLCAEDLPAPKPHLGAFTQCLQKLQLSAEECLLIDDHAEVLAVADSLGFSTLHPAHPTDWQSGIAGILPHSFQPGFSRRHAESLCVAGGSNATVLKPLLGGSGAFTLLREQGGTLEVQKIALAGEADRLHLQAQWLTTHQDLAEVVNVRERAHFAGGFSYTTDWLQSYRPMSEVVHQQSRDHSRQLLHHLLDFLEAKLFNPEPSPVGPEALLSYIQTKFFGKLAEAASLHPDIAALTGKATLLINGVEVANPAMLMTEILDDARLVASLQEAPLDKIHGDLSLENILVRGQEFVLIDPNPEPLLPSRLLDYGKLYASLNSGFEFLKELPSLELDGGHLRYLEVRSEQYASLQRFLRTELKARLTPTLLAQVHFHEAIHFTRMLPYRARIQPATAVAFYGAAARSLASYARAVRKLGFLAQHRYKRAV